MIPVLEIMNRQDIACQVQADIGIGAVIPIYFGGQLVFLNIFVRPSGHLFKLFRIAGFDPEGTALGDDGFYIFRSQDGPQSAPAQKTVSGTDIGKPDKIFPCRSDDQRPNLLLCKALSGPPESLYP